MSTFYNKPISTLLVNKPYLWIVQIMTNVQVLNALLLLWRLRITIDRNRGLFFCLLIHIYLYTFINVNEFLLILFFYLSLCWLHFFLFITYLVSSVSNFFPLVLCEKFFLVVFMRYGMNLFGIFKNYKICKFVQGMEKSWYRVPGIEGFGLR